MSKERKATIEVLGTTITVLSQRTEGYISLTDMLKAKDGDFFISDWLRNHNTVEFLGIWESVHNPDFNYGEFALIKSQAGLNSFKISVKEWVAKTNAVGLRAAAGRYDRTLSKLNYHIHTDAIKERLIPAAEFIHMELPQGERLKRLNEIAIRQMQVLTAAPALKQLRE